jgi:alpha-glucosidase
VEYINTGDELHLAHNFVFFHPPWRAAAFGASVLQFTDLAAAAAWPAWFLENQDHSRVATRYADAPGTGPRRARVAAMMICALRGTPVLYYGQELGLPDAEILPDRVVDVDVRDPERAPMPWRRPSQAGPGAGFTTGEPWLPSSPTLNACAWRRRRRTRRRRSRSCAASCGCAREPTLQSGVQIPVSAGPDVLCFERRGDQRFLIALNFSSHPVPLRLGDEAGVPAAEALIELSTDPGRGHGRADPWDLMLGPDEGIILRLG